MSIGELLVANEGHVRVLTLNRPERRNALSYSLMRSLSEAALAADADDEVRVVVITGAGDRAFCAGGDVKEMGGDDAAGRKFQSPMARVDRTVFEVVAEVRKPVIAALNGSAVAGGFELALACDIRIGHSEVELGLPEAKIGMGANFGSVVLPRYVPQGIALELLYTGDYIDARRGAELGLINRLVKREEVLPESMALAQKIAANAPLSVRRMKAMARGRDLPLAAALRMNPGVDPYLSEDRQEGIRARNEKRRPAWKGK